MIGLTGFVLVLAVVALPSGALQPLDEAPAAEAGVTHTVAADGTGDYTSIQDAVDAATDGDVVRVMQGTYAERIVIDKDLSLVGDGPRAEVVITPPTDGSPESDLPGSGRPYALWLAAETVSLTDLTVATPDGTTGVVVTAGAPWIERLSILGQAEMRASAYSHAPYTSMEFFGGSRPTVRDSEWDGYVAVRDGASATFVGNTVHGDTISIDGPGESSVRESTLLRGSISMSWGARGVIEANEFHGDISQVGVDTGSAVEVRGNTFTGSAEDASIWIEGSDTTAVISDNTVVDSVTAIRISQAGAAAVEGNVLEATAVGIVVTGSNAVIRGNTIESDGAGIGITGSADATITGNVIDAGGRAVFISGPSAPVVTGNVICGGEESFFIAAGASPEISDNDVCGVRVE